MTLIHHTMDAVKKLPTPIPDVFVLEPRVFHDGRGFFLESYNQRLFAGLGIAERDADNGRSRDRKRAAHGPDRSVER